MNQMKKIWNYKLKESQYKSTKFTALRLFAWLLAIMVTLTLVSRAADARTIGMVSTESPRRAPIVRSASVDGVIESSGGTPIIAPIGEYVKEVAVKNGDMVAVGDFLFSYDIANHQAKITALQLDIKGLELQREDMDITEGNKEKEQESLRERKEEDLTATEVSFELRLEALAQRVNQARIAFSKYDRVGRNDYDEDGEYSEEEYESLKSSLRALQLEYEQLTKERDVAFSEVERAIEDLDKAETPDNSKALRELDIQKAKLELSKLYTDVSSGGKIYATSQGLVTDLKVAIGDTVPGGASLTITEEGGLKLTATLSEEERKLIDIGNQVTLKPFSSQEKFKNLVVTDIQPNKEDPQRFDVTVDVGETKLALGTGATIYFGQHSETYFTVVSLSSIYYDGSQAFVLVQDQKETTLGLEYFARRVNVVVSESNATNAAISGSITPEDKIIASSDKPLGDGSRIRLGDSQ